MQRKLSAVLAAATVFVVLTAVSAQAANTVTKTINGNTLSASIVINSSIQATCGGDNRHSPAPRQILVSYICQYRDANMVWHDFFAAPASSCPPPTNCTDTLWHYVSFNPCSYLPTGTWKIRGESDGYWVDTGGVMHNYTGTLNTTSPFPSFRCPVGGSAPAGHLDDQHKKP